MDESVHHDANRNMSAMDMLHTGHLDPSQPIYSTPDHSVHDHSAHDHSAHSGHESQSNVHSMMSHMMSMAVNMSKYVHLLLITNKYFLAL